MVGTVLTFKKIDVPLRVKTFDKVEGTFSGYLSTWSLDLQRDRIQPGAFKKTLVEANSARTRRGDKNLFVILWQHQPSEPIGAVLDAEEDQIGLKVQGFLDLDTELGRRAFSAISKGYVSAMSIGYRTIKDKMLSDGTRLLEQVELIEASLVTFPANTEARVGNIKTREALFARKHGARGERLMKRIKNPLVEDEQAASPNGVVLFQDGKPGETRSDVIKAMQADARRDDDLYQLHGKAFDREVQARRLARERKQREQKDALEAERKALAEKDRLMAAPSFTPSEFALATGLDEAWIRGRFNGWVASGNVTAIDEAALRLDASDIRRMYKREHDLFESRFIEMASRRAQEVQ